MSLSEGLFTCKCGRSGYYISYVKEFIRLLRKELNPLDFDKGDLYTTTIAEQNARIDKLAGEHFAISEDDE